MSERRSSVPIRTYVDYLNAETSKRFDTMVAYFLRTIAELDSRNTTDLRAVVTASDIAINKAEQALGKRLDLLNEFRSQVADQTARFLARETYESQQAALEHRISELNDRLTRIETAAAAGRRSLAVAVTIVGLAITIVAIVVPLVVK